MEVGIFIAGIALSLIGLILNTAESILLIRQKARKTKYQNLLRSLSAADVCTSLFFLSSFTIRQYAFTNDKESEERIIFVVLRELLWFSVSSSLLHVLAISFDRLLAVRFPLKHRFWYTHRKNIALIVIIWVLSFLFIIPAIVTFLKTRRNHLIKVLISSLVLLTGLVLVLLYAYIIRKTVSKECMFEIITLQSGKKEVVSACSPREKRILLTSVLIVISYFICSLPFAIVYVVTENMHDTVLLILSNSILNPLVYFFQRYYQDKKDETIRRKKDQPAKNSQDNRMVKLSRPETPNLQFEKEQKNGSYLMSKMHKMDHEET